MKRAHDDVEPGKKIRLQCYRDSYSKEWPFYAPSKVSKHHVFCKTCGSDFNVSHGGRDDCRRHAATKKHKDFEKLKCQTLDKHFCSRNESDSTRAELLFVTFLVEHNLPIAAADHAKNLFLEMFPDSKIAKRFTCARTKASSLIRCLAESTTSTILSAVRQKYFALATDGSNDLNDKKLYPIVITYFDELEGRNNTVMLSLIATTENTGEGIFNAINDEFKRKEIPWSNCLSFACDNANTMIGHVKGVASFIKKFQPSLVVSRCSCHLIHLSAKHATSKLQFDFEQFIVQIFFYLEKSSKRKKSFSESQVLCNVKPYKILKYISTRWLSLQTSIDRILDQWEALEHFFDNQPNNEHSTQLKNIQGFFKNPLTKLYCLFLSSVLPVFTSLNENLQQEAPQIHKLKRKYSSFLMDIVSRFIKPCAISVSKDLKNIKVEKREKQKDDCDLVIGGKTRSVKESLNLSEKQISSFYESVRSFYVTAYSYIVKKFPLDDEFLGHVEAADVGLRKNVSFSSIRYLSSLLNFSAEDLDKVEIEFSLYQNDEFSFEESERIDEIWYKISLMKTVSGELKYGTLGKLMNSVLTVSHSNAGTERIFSLVKKNMTDFRPNLSTECLNAILVEKVKNLSDRKMCYERKFTNFELDAARKATRQNL